MSIKTKREWDSQFGQKSFECQEQKTERMDKDRAYFVANKIRVLISTKVFYVLSKHVTCYG